MRRLRPALLAVALLAAGPATAQRIVTEPVPASPLLTVSQDRLFTDSRIGRAALARFEQESAALLAENRRIEAALEAEERALTEQRATLPAAEFRVLAEAFDAKVEEIRTAREARSRALTRQRDADRQRIFEAAAPVLAAMMEERGALAIMDRSTLLMSFDRIDITADAIIRLDAVLGDGGKVLSPALPEPEPGPTPGPVPEPPPVAPGAPAPDGGGEAPPAGP